MRSQLLLAEIGALRGELNAVVDRMNWNENFSAGTVSAIYAFVLTNELSFISLLLALVALIVVAVGIQRYYELRTHLRKVDAYLRRIETELSNGGGWTSHYYRSIAGATSGGYSTTRFVFWSGMAAAAVLGAGYVGAEFYGVGE